MTSRIFLGIALFLLPASALSAQDAQETFDRGMAHFHSGNYEAAQTAFREVVSQSPEQASAYALLNASQDALLELLVAGGEFGSFAREILASASATSKAAIRDTAAAAADAEGCFADSYEARAQAIFALTQKYGPFAAVPLIDALGAQKESRRLAAIYALSRMGSEATMPLLAATWSTDANVRSGAALALAQINDARANARLSDMAATDEDGTTRVLAGQLGLVGNAADLYDAQGWSYLVSDASMGLSSAENHGAFFATDGAGVRAIDMPEPLVGLEAAKRCFLRASTLEHRGAPVGLAQAYAAEITVLKGLMADGAEDLEPVLQAQITSALTLPISVLEHALADATRRNAIGTAISLVDLLDGASSSSVDALQAALASSMPSLRFAAAQALAGFGAADGAVIHALAQATALDALRIVHLVDTDEFRVNSLTQELDAAGIAVIHATDGAGAFINMHRSVMVDAFVLADPLPDFYARRVVSEIRNDDRFNDTPITVIGNDQTGDIDGADVVESITAFNIIEGFGSLGSERERYLATASAAASALAQLAQSNPASLEAVASSLTSAANREDAVSIPVMYVLGRSGSADHADTLLAVVGESSRSDEARVAAAKALATLVDRTSATANEQVLESAMAEGKAELARACARVLAAGGNAHRPAMVIPE